MKVVKKMVKKLWDNTIKAYDENGEKIQPPYLVDESTEYVHHVTGYGEMKTDREGF